MLPNKRAKKIYNYLIFWKFLQWKYLKYLHLYTIFILPKTQEMSNLFSNDIVQSNIKGEITSDPKMLKLKSRSKCIYMCQSMARFYWWKSVSKRKKSRRPNVTLYLMARFLETYVSSKHTGTIYSRKIKAIVPEQLACRLMRFGSFVYIDNVLISNWFQYPQF